MSDISSHDLRNRTADVLRRVEAGERIRISVNQRPVAELVPLGRPQWASGAAFERLLVGGRADPGLLHDLGGVRSQTVEPRLLRPPSPTRPSSAQSSRPSASGAGLRVGHAR